MVVSAQHPKLMELVTRENKKKVEELSLDTYEGVEDFRKFFEEFAQFFLQCSLILNNLFPPNPKPILRALSGLKAYGLL